MPVQKLTCSWKDAETKLPKSLRHLPVNDVTSETDGCCVYIQGFVKDRSAVLHTKRFDYMKFSVQDGDSTSGCISMFASGGITQQLDKVDKGDFLMINGFSVEGSTSIQANSHPCQIVLDEEMFTPQVWYVSKTLTADDSQEPSTSTAHPTTSSTNMEKTVKKDSVTLNSKSTTDSSATQPRTASTGVAIQQKVYCDISSLKPNTTVNIYGVVKFVKQPYKTRGTDYTMMVTVVDPSSGDDKLKCLLFSKEAANFPKVSIGDVLRFHRLKVCKFAGYLQGQSGPGWSWLFVSGKSQTGEPCASSANYSYTEQDKVKVKELFDWASSRYELCQGGKSGTIEEIIPGLYLDLVCQVVSTCVVEESVCFVLKVWDGTRTIYMVREMKGEEQTLQSDRELEARAQNLSVDVALYDDHFNSGSSVKPGQFVRLCNLHAARYKRDTATDLSSLPMVELVMHRGTSFGRGVVILEDDSQDVISLKHRLDKIPPARMDELTSQEAKMLLDDSLDFSVASESKINNPKSAALPSESGRLEITCDDCNAKMNGPCCTNCNKTVKSRGMKRPMESPSVNNGQGSKRNKRNCLVETNNQAGVDMSFNQSELEITCDQHSQSESQESVARCMLQTVTVVLNHPHVEQSKIKQVLDHRVPYKFRVLVHVEDYFPKPKTALDLVKLYCEKCHCLESIPLKDARISDTDSPSSPLENPGSTAVLVLRSEEDGVSHYNCPQCDTSSPDDVPVLQYTYMMRFLLRDSTGQVVANLWNSDAVTFFKDIQPTEVVKSQKALQEVRDMLEQICPQNSAGKPLVECCLKSYSVDQDTGYQIFDTCVV